MFAKGYRPKSQDHHLVVVSFVEVVYLQKFPADILKSFGKARLRRNESLYDKAGSISQTQAQDLVQKADVFISTALEIIK